MSEVLTCFRSNEERSTCSYVINTMNRTTKYNYQSLMAKAEECTSRREAIYWINAATKYMEELVSLNHLPVSEE